MVFVAGLWQVGKTTMARSLPQTESWQVSATGRKDYQTPEGIRVAPALALLDRLV